MDPHPPPSSPPDQALAFASVADAYHRARPSYPLAAAEWMTGRIPTTVVELGAGTGKFTDRLVELSHDVLATDPLEEMLEYLRRRHPQLRVAQAPAEAIPAATRSVDTVVAAQSFHWFDVDVALREAARVLKPEGRIALVWNELDDRIPWVRRFRTLIGPLEHDLDPTDVLVSSKLFGYVEDMQFRHWQPMRKAELRDLVRSRSNVAVMDPMAQERLLRKVDELVDGNGSGPDGVLLPYVTRCYRAVVRPRGLIDEPEHSADLTAAANAVREAGAAVGAAVSATADAAAGAGWRPRSEEEPATTLIDFR